MRFKSRLFPLIDVMILMLGLFLVILAKAQLTVEAETAIDGEQKGETDNDGQTRGVPYKKGLVLEYRFEQDACFTIDTNESIKTTAALLNELSERGIKAGDECVITILHPSDMRWNEGIKDSLQRKFGDDADNRDVAFQSMQKR